MVEGLQWGLQGPVSSAARKRETAGTWGTSSGPQGGGVLWRHGRVGRECPLLRQHLAAPHFPWKGED